MVSGGPTEAGERIEVLDALRGFALLGILAMNLVGLTAWDSLPPARRAASATAAFDGTAEYLLKIVFHAKFYTVFSLLFGIGFSLQLGKGDEARRRFVRRLAWLFVIGMLHMTVLWGGDILAPYALCGFLLLAFERVSNRAILLGAAALVVLPIGLHAIHAASGGVLEPGHHLKRVGDAIWMPPGNDAFAVVSGDDWSQLSIYQATSPFYRFGNLLAESRLMKILAVFLIGLWVGRSGILRDLEAHRPLLRRVVAIGLAIGIPCSVAFEYLAKDGAWSTNAEGVLETAIYAAGMVPMGLAYAAGFALLFLRPRWRRVLGRLAPAGRMALTNYLSHSFVAFWVFLGVGLGLAGQLPPTFWLPTAIAVILVQAWLSNWWLRDHRFGPIEWVWRQLTYGRRLPLRRDPGPGVRMR